MLTILLCLTHLFLPNLVGGLLAATERHAAMFALAVFVYLGAVLRRRSRKPRAGSLQHINLLSL